MGQQHVRVARRRDEHAREVDERPVFPDKTEVIKVVELPGSVVSAKQVHSLPEHCRASSVPAFRPHTFSSDFAPLVCCKAVLVQIVFVVPVVAAENVHVRIEDDS